MPPYAGKHPCEKPLSMDTAEGQEMVDAVEKAGVANTVWYNYRRIPAVTLAKQLIDEGRLGHATLDVFRKEPLPPGHRFWTHPRVTVTPHIAAATRPETASLAIARNIRRGEDGAPFLDVVDRAAGY